MAELLCVERRREAKPHHNSLPSCSLPLKIIRFGLNKSVDSRHQSLTTEDNNNVLEQNRKTESLYSRSNNIVVEVKLLKSQTTNQTRLSRIILRRVAPFHSEI